MTTHELSQHLQGLLPEIRSTGNPEAVLLKHATDNNFAPAQLEKMAQIFNKAKTLTFLEKQSATGGDRGAAFKLIDTADLLQKYTAPDEDIVWGKSASAPREGSYVFPSKVEGVTKFAAEPTPSASRNQHKELLSQIKAAYRNADTCGEVCADLSKDFRDIVVKIAQSDRDYLAESLEDASLLAPGAHTEFVIDQVSKAANVKPATTSRVVLRDRHNALDDFTKAATILDTIAAGKEMQGEFLAAAKVASALLDALEEGVKEAAHNAGAGVLDPPKADTHRDDAPRPKRDGKKPAAPLFDFIAEKQEGGKPESKSKGSIFDHAIRLGQGVDIGAAARMAPQGMAASLIPEALHGHRNLDQEKVDKAYDDANFLTSLHKLLIADPILAEADPHQVVGLANSLRDTNPAVAKDVNVLRALLREGIQYDALPAHTIKDLTTIRRERAQAMKDEGVVASDLYKI